MSKVKIEGNASGTGTLTISAPNTNTDRSLTLPDGAGEILLSDGDGSNLTGVGKVLQVVQGTTTTQVDVSTSSWTDIGLSVNITPSSTSSKIYVMATPSYMWYGGAQEGEFGIRILRDSTNLRTGNVNQLRLWESDTNTYGQVGMVTPYDYLDSPSTTSQITYKMQSVMNSGNWIRFNYQSNNESVITAWEIGG